MFPTTGAGVALTAGATVRQQVHMLRNWRHVLAHGRNSDARHCGSWRDALHDWCWCCVPKWSRRNVLLDKCRWRILLVMARCILLVLPRLGPQ